MRLSEKDKDLLREIITENTELVIENDYAVFEKLDVEKITQGILEWFFTEMKKMIEQ